jgi:hypothetical protein
MTIPTLLSNVRKHQYASRLKKTISTLSNAARMSSEQYGYDYSGLSAKCTKNSASDTPEKMTICGMLNGTLTGAQFYWGLNNFPDYDIISSKFYKDSDSFYNYYNRIPVYQLSDGTIIVFSSQIGGFSCKFNLAKNSATLDPSTGYGTFCYALVDVNGTSLPNKETTCSTGSDNYLTRNVGNCIVKAEDVQDIFVIAFYDGIVEPASSATWYVWQHY